MFTHGIIPKALVAGFVLSLSSVASAHHFPKPKTSADLAAERAAACRAEARPAKRTFARFGPARLVESGAPYTVASAHRFGPRDYVPPVTCPHPTRTIAGR